MKAGGPSSPRICPRIGLLGSSRRRGGFMSVPSGSGRRFWHRLARRRKRTSAEPAAPLLELRVGPVVFVLDVADDLFEDVFQGDKAQDLLLIVADDRHRPVRPAEQLQGVG